VPGWRATFSDEFASGSAKNHRTEGRLRAAATHHGIPLADWLDLSTDINPDPWPGPALPAGVWRHLPEEKTGWRRWPPTISAEPACCRLPARRQ